uniref:Uncharacterized protein n=1 Tax=Anguilla anguilla TaxID=7936 RepID=A0A0E9Q2K4_ANGAN
MTKGPMFPGSYVPQLYMCALPGSYVPVSHFDTFKMIPIYEREAKDLVVSAVFETVLPPLRGVNA